MFKPLIVISFKFHPPTLKATYAGAYAASEASGFNLNPKLHDLMGLSINVVIDHL